MKTLWYFSSERSGARLLLFEGGGKGGGARQEVSGRRVRSCSTHGPFPVVRRTGRAAHPASSAHGLILIPGGRQGDANPGVSLDSNPGVSFEGPEGAA
jgi:hypothetical protein